MIEYFLANYRQENKEELYRNYISECLRYINTSIAKRHGGNYFKKSYQDTVRASFKPPKKQKPAKKIIEDVTKKAGLVVRD